MGMLMNEWVIGGLLVVGAVVGVVAYFRIKGWVSRRSAPKQVAAQPAAANTPEYHG